MNVVMKSIRIFIYSQCIIYLEAISGRIHKNLVVGAASVRGVKWLQ